ncbi:porin [Methylobacterium sp. Leaf108]|uniref:porin n=2 Tax=unclassified Methylobacterium TaxID=2615210 RepID=UPI0007014336|nr:porin [Methylobacterium sp. Leaf108]KQP55150.1 porin [Methylobacterium sp. Leaf108]
MRLLKSSLLGSVAGVFAVAGAQSADLPVKKAAPIEYVRVCSAYGAGFFYIPGTDTCLRLSGRARFEVGYGESKQRSGTNGDLVGYRGLARINLDARTQTGYGTLRAFARLEFASRTGGTQGIRSGTQERIGNAFGATGQDQAGHVQQFVNTDKAFIQFAGFTAGRASSFFDFYAHDFEIQASTAGSDLQSTNLLAYTTKLGASGFSATLSLEDPAFRRNTIYSQEFANPASGANNVAAQRVLFGTVGVLPAFQTVDVRQSSRLPDFVGVLRYDAAWGSAQLSAAVKELNTQNFIAGSAGAAANIGALTPGFALPGVGPTARPGAEYGWAVQGGVKINLPFIAPGDTFYLQGAYGEGASLYTGVPSYNGSYTSRISTINGAAFDPYMSDATLNPFTGKIETSKSFSIVGSFLHYWSPEWRSAVFASYSEIEFARGARQNNALAYSGAGTATNNNFTGIVGTRSFALAPTLRDNYQIVAGASLIWSPVKDLDIGVEGLYTKVGVQSGRVIDQTRNAPLTAAAINAGAAVRTVTADDTYQVRMRVQRDF